MESMILIIYAMQMSSVSIVCVCWLAQLHTAPKSSIWYLYLLLVIDDFDFVHSLIFCSAQNQLPGIKCSDLSDEALASTCERDLPSAVLTTNIETEKVLFPKKPNG